MSGLTLAQSLALLNDPAPKDYDPEESFSAFNKVGGQGDDSEDGDEVDGNQGREHYIEVGPSTLRSSNKPPLTDPKYDGAKSSRRAIFDDDEDEEDEEFGDEDEDSEDENMNEHDEEDEEEDDSDDDKMVFSDDGEQSEEQEDEPRRSSGKFGIAASASPPPELTSASAEAQQIISSLQQARSSDITKGIAVKSQLDLFSSILPVRIRLQKGLTAAGSLPQRKDRFKSEKEKELVDDIFVELKTLSEGLFELREGLSRINWTESTLPASKRQRSLSPSAYIPLATSDSISISDAQHPYLLTTLNKWSSKILQAQGLSGSLLQKDKFKSVKVGVVDQIEVALAGEEGRSKYKRAREDGDSLWDDTEFYQGLLREIIERKGGSASTSAIAAPTHSNFMPRAKKATLDTKASKGRKLRYTSQEKIQNFMVPIQLPAGGWHEEQIDELFASLLGKTIKMTGGDEDDNAGTMEETQLDGLRMF